MSLSIMLEWWNSRSKVINGKSRFLTWLAGVCPTTDS